MKKNRISILGGIVLVAAMLMGAPGLVDSQAGEFLAQPLFTTNGFVISSTAATTSSPPSAVAAFVPPVSVTNLGTLVFQGYGVGAGSNNFLLQRGMEKINADRSSSGRAWMDWQTVTIYLRDKTVVTTNITLVDNSGMNWQYLRVVNLTHGFTAATNFMVLSNAWYTGWK